MLVEIIAWLHGWRVDLDGWWVRARRESDPDLRERPDVGYTEEACIAVRSAWLALKIDRKATT